MYFILLIFKKMAEAIFANFVNLLIERTNTVLAYSSVQEQVTDVMTANAAYTEAAADAAGGDHTKLLIRRDKRKLLEHALIVLALKMQVEGGENLAYFTAVGWTVRLRNLRTRAPLDAPSIQFLRQGVKSGSFRGLSSPLPKGFEQMVIQYSDDDGETWKLAGYSTGRKFKVEGLPIQMGYLIRIAMTGTHNRMSDWSGFESLFLL